jgi:hypothetical protein
MPICKIAMEVLADSRRIDFHLQPELKNRSGCFTLLK